MRRAFYRRMLCACRDGNLSEELTTRLVGIWRQLRPEDRYKLFMIDPIAFASAARHARYSSHAVPTRRGDRSCERLAAPQMHGPGQRVWGITRDHSSCSMRLCSSTFHVATISFLSKGSRGKFSRPATGALGFDQLFVVCR